jgi:hypothetical protein
MDGAAVWATADPEQAQSPTTATITRTPEFSHVELAGFRLMRVSRATPVQGITGADLEPKPMSLKTLVVAGRM